MDSFNVDIDLPETLKYCYINIMYCLLRSSTDKDSIGSNKQQEAISAVKTQASSQGPGSSAVDICSATFLDVAVLRCLFIPQWQEEGVYWALQFYYHR
jgi:hypothetical protein